MKKILLFLLLLLPINIYAVELPDTYSQKVLIYDLTDEKVLFSKKSDEVSDIASLTKLMTVLIGVENIEDLDKEVTITYEMIAGVPWDASIAKLKVGDTVTYRDLLYGVMLPSGADAAHALARNVSGSLESYVKLMNEKSSSLGMENTNYVNVTGLDAPNHKSTLNDLLKLLTYALKNKTFKEIYTTHTYTMKNNQEIKSTVNGIGTRLNYDISRIIGAKTGYTGDAGTCISVLFHSNGHDFLALTLKAPYNINIFHNIVDAMNLIKFIDNNFNNQTLIEENELIKEIKVALSTIEKYEVKSTIKIEAYLPNDYDKEKIKINYEGKEEISFTTLKDTKLGKISYYYDGKLLGEEDVILKQVIEMDAKKVFSEYKEIFIASIIGVVIFLIISLLIMKKTLKH